jgi:polynucleotide 5'-kinase involved in rRNA processing
MDEEQLNEMNEEDEGNIVVLEAEGEAVEFEYIDTIDYEGEEYVVLLPVDEDEEAEVVILKVQKLDTLDEDGEPEEEYVSVESEELLNTLFEMFKAEYADDFDFVED